MFAVQGAKESLEQIIQRALGCLFIMSESAPQFTARILVKLAVWLQEQSREGVCPVDFNPICWETSEKRMHRGWHQASFSNRKLDLPLAASHSSLSYDAISSTNKRTYLFLPLLPLTSYSTLHTTTYTLPASLFSTSPRWPPHPQPIKRRKSTR